MSMQEERNWMSGFLVATIRNLIVLKTNLVLTYNIL